MKEQKTKLEELSDRVIVSEEVAEKEIESWFEYRKLRPDLRDNPNHITGDDIQKKSLIKSVMYGILKYNPETGELIQKLDFPVEKDGQLHLSELTYKPRLTRLEILKLTRGLKATDSEGRIAAYLSASTGVPVGILNKMDEADRGLSDTIAGYFFQ